MTSNKKVAKRLSFGDVFEVRIGSRLAYLQYIQFSHHLGEIARVFTQLYDERPIDLRGVSQGKSFRVFYPMKAALKSPALVELVSHNELSDEDSQPARLRNGIGDPNGSGRWTLYVGDEMRRVTQLTAEQRSWPEMYRGLSHQGLIDEICQQNGIASERDDRLENDEGKSSFFLFFRRRSDAAAAALSGVFPTFITEIVKSDNRWMLMFRGVLEEPLSDAVRTLETLAKRFNGEFDGFEVPEGVAL